MCVLYHISAVSATAKWLESPQNFPPRNRNLSKLKAHHNQTILHFMYDYDILYMFSMIKEV